MIFYICSDYYELSKTKTSRQYDSFILDESKSVPKQNVQKEGTVRNISQKFYNLQMENNEIGKIQQSPADPKHYRYVSRISAQIYRPFSERWDFNLERSRFCDRPIYRLLTVNFLYQSFCKTDILTSGQSNWKMD